LPGGADDQADRRDLIRKLNPLGRIRLRLAARLHEYASDLTRGDLNFTWITESLAAGGSVRSREYHRLRRLGITGVIDVRSEGLDDRGALERQGIQLLHLPVPDRYAPDPAQLAEGVRWAREHLERGGRVFAHCEHGVGRGPLMVTAILVTDGVGAPDALQFVRERRWQTAPNDRQIEGLLAFESYWWHVHGRSAEDAEGVTAAGGTT
jgi:hypothetical protein